MGRETGNSDREHWDERYRDEWNLRTGRTTKI